MTDFFLKIFNMSISASYLILAVLLFRLLLKKAPKWVAVVLWGLVAVRLVLPAPLPNPLSLIPSTETVSPQIMTDPTPSIQSGIPLVNNTVNPIIGEVFAPALGESVNPLQIWIPVLAGVWLAGMAAMLIYTAVSYFRIKKKIGTAVLLRDNLFQSERVISPFVLGIVKPKIYLPFAMTEKDLPHVIAHEQAHIKRKDHLWKPLGFLLLTLHWFNPLMWLGYILLCRDIELACDEKVVKTLDRELRADYSQALLNCSVNRRMIAACPLAFGETGVKSRVKSVLHYKKPAFWLLIAAVLVFTGVAVFFLTDPLTDDNTGAKSLSLEWRDEQTVEFELRYAFPQGPSYSVRYVPEDEGEYTGDGMIPYDGKLGKYRVLIEFGDMEPSKAFREKFRTGKPVELANTPIRILAKCAHTSGHGFVLYLGFDRPISVPSVKGKLGTFGGTLKIPVTLLPDPYGELADRYPEYFGLDYSKGLDVYVWQMGAGSSSFGLQPHADPPESPVSEKLLSMKSASIEEMRQILTAYPVTAEEIHIIPWSHPASSYLPPWGMFPAGGDGEKEKQLYTKELREALLGITEYTSFVDPMESIVFDIDGDGEEEICSLYSGPTSGFNTLTITVEEEDYAYYRILLPDHDLLSCKLSLEVGENNTLLLKAVSNDPAVLYQYTLFIVGGQLHIDSPAQDVWWTATELMERYLIDRKIFDVDGTA